MSVSDRDLLRLLGHKGDGDLLPQDFVKRLRRAIHKAHESSIWDRTRQALTTQEARKVVNEVGIIPLTVAEADLRLGEKSHVRTIITKHYYSALASSDAALVNLAGAFAQTVADIRGGKTEAALKRCVDGLVYAGGAHKRLRKELLLLIGSQAADHWNQEPPVEWTVASDAGKQALDLDAAARETKTQRKRKDSAPRQQNSSAARAPGRYNPGRFDRGGSGGGYGGGRRFDRGPPNDRPFFRQDRGSRRDGNSRP